MHRKVIPDIVKITDILTMKSDGSVSEAAKLLARKNVAAMIVVDEFDNVSGIVTERDLCQKVLAKGLDPDSTALGDITLDWGTDGIQEYTVEFAYEYWTHGHNDARTAGSTSEVTEDSNVVSGRTVAT